jgi:dihydrofolate synthase/folylpolyglutamate synthase
VTTPATGLADWLARIESLHPKAIDLGLDRVGRVRDALDLQPGFPIITVGGTNGKGSTCAYLNAILTAAGYRVGLYTSPHLLRYNERVRIGDTAATDASIVASLEAVEAARGKVSLTYYEHATLAAMWQFCQEKIDVAVLEVGLGGRLDAVNLFDADCSVVTAIGIDHQDYLGPDRESIGFEKAGILRGGRPAICSDRAPPARLLAHAADIGAQLWLLGRDFHVEASEQAWLWRAAGTTLPALPRRYQLDNAAAAIAALQRLRQRLPVPLKAIRMGLASARQPGRFQVIGRQPLRILDVAHNPQAAAALAGNLAVVPPTGRTLAVLAMLADKDIAGVIAAVAPHVDAWHIAPLGGPRGAGVEVLASSLMAAGQEASAHPDVASAWRAACQEAGPADTIIAFGSFYTVADILELHSNDG